MNKKLLLATMSLAVLAACTNDDDFGSKTIAEKASPVKFEVLNNNQAMTRASMDGNKIVWSAEDGDLFTLYHGGASLTAVTGYQNATYTASTGEGTATLSTPSMILPGAAIMVWPVDTIFGITSGGNLAIKVPAVQTNIENSIPYVSDLINIQDREDADPVAEPNWKIGDPNTAGYDRKYPVYMRPMASQLIVKADYAGTDETIAALYEGGSACPADGGIDPISVTSVDLLTAAGGTTKFTKEIPVKFTDPGTGAGSIKKQWDDNVEGNAWAKVTDFNVAEIADGGKTAQLTAKEDCIDGTNGCKFLILPQAVIPATGVADAAVVVNTRYGKVVIAEPGVAETKYTAEEVGDAWYRYVSASAIIDADETKAPAAGSDGKFKTTANVAKGMKQTLNAFSAYTATKGIVKGEPIGAAATRYVKVLLNHLDMSDLHIKDDKQLRDVAVVWKYLYPEAAAPIAVILDGNEDGEFEISQNTINYINTLKKEDGTPLFTVKPCVLPGEICETIVITGGGDIQDMPFIIDNAGTKADVALNEGETWNWKGTTADAKTVKLGAGVSSIINRGTMVNAATATLATYDAASGVINNVPLVNEGTWNINAGTLNVQFPVTNYGTVNIAKGAQYRQDAATAFTNEAETTPERFNVGVKNYKEIIGKVVNKGVFATVSTGRIDNYGLIEHADVDAMTFVTTNQVEGTTFATAFKADAADPADNRKMGRINLPFSNKGEENISISAGLDKGFVSVTVDGDAGQDELDASVVGSRVNYVIVKSGIKTISKISSQVKYVEINSPGTMIAWSVAESGYDGLIVLSDVNIMQGTKVAATATYLGADMYVGGIFNKDAAVTINKGTAAVPDNVNYAATEWAGYYGDTAGNVATKYITF